MTDRLTDRPTDRPTLLPIELLSQLKTAQKTKVISHYGHAIGTLSLIYCIGKIAPRASMNHFILVYCKPKLQHYRLQFSTAKAALYIAMSVGLSVCLLVSPSVTTSLNCHYIATVLKV